LSDINKIKAKILAINPQRWWGDDFDVRFFLISKLKGLQNKKILDVGGGIGIICSEIDQTNLRINLDSSFNDLRVCKDRFDNNIQNICASMTNLPFSEKLFDVAICAHLLEVGKYLDIQNDDVVKLERKNSYPTVDKILSEISNVLDSNGVLYLTTPNNAYYNKIKLTYEELKDSLHKKFVKSKIFFFNTHSKLGNNRKMNMANVFPKIISKFINPDKVLNNLLKSESADNYSVSFFVEAKLEQ